MKGHKRFLFSVTLNADIFWSKILTSLSRQVGTVWSSKCHFLFLNVNDLQVILRCTLVRQSFVFRVWDETSNRHLHRHLRSKRGTEIFHVTSLPFAFAHAGPYRNIAASPNSQSDFMDLWKKIVVAAAVVQSRRELENLKPSLKDRNSLCYQN